MGIKWALLPPHCSARSDGTGLQIDGAWRYLESQSEIQQPRSVLVIEAATRIAAANNDHDFFGRPVRLGR